jgi:hypothetical protein
MSNNKGNASFATESLRGNEEIRREVATSDLFTRLKGSLKKVEVDGETYYLAEGDTLLDEDQLGVYANARQKQNEARRAAAIADFAGLGTERLGVQSRGLIAMTQNGKIVRWAPGTVLSYRVAKNTFTNSANYDMVVDFMTKATKEWQDTCGIEFRHMEDLDDDDGVKPGNALFVVREIDAGGAFIASAFFPNDPKDRRRVLIDPSFYTTDFDHIGVLRHELGHVLGFRHEHIHKTAPPACHGEDDFDSVPLTGYDSVSVMHYFCGGVGSRQLKISDLDRTGAQQVYGPPLTNILFVPSA